MSHSVFLCTLSHRAPCGNGGLWHRVSLLLPLDGHLKHWGPVTSIPYWAIFFVLTIHRHHRVCQASPMSCTSFMCSGRLGNAKLPHIRISRSGGCQLPEHGAFRDGNQKIRGMAWEVQRLISGIRLPYRRRHLWSELPIKDISNRKKWRKDKGAASAIRS